jgi:hypothetical protein
MPQVQALLSLPFFKCRDLAKFPAPHVAVRVKNQFLKEIATGKA